MEFKVNLEILVILVGESNIVLHNYDFQKAVLVIRIKKKYHSIKK